MSIQSDPSFYKSDYDRRENDRYFTESACTKALCDRLPYAIEGVVPRTVWEPACGRGDLAAVVKGEMAETVICSDIDTSEFIPELFDSPSMGAFQIDFLGQVCAFDPSFRPDAIITNPPYGDLAEAFARKWLKDYPDIPVMALLLRQGFDNAKSRTDLFGDCPAFAGEIALTWRPRWDWWLSDKALGPEAKKQGPRHNFSWFIWDRAHTGAPVKLYAGRPVCERKK